MSIEYGYYSIINSEQALWYINFFYEEYGNGAENVSSVQLGGFVTGAVLLILLADIATTLILFIIIASLIQYVAMMALRIDWLYNHGGQITRVFSKSEFNLIFELAYNTSLS